MLSTPSDDDAARRVRPEERVGTAAAGTGAARVHPFALLLHRTLRLVHEAQ